MMEYGFFDINYEDLLRKVFKFVEDFYSSNLPSHDIQHALQVFCNVRHISSQERLDSKIAEISALFHDIIQDKKSSGADVRRSAAIAKDFLLKNCISEDISRSVHDTIILSSWEFSNSNPSARSESTLLLRDADLLESIGAHGIARVFSYSGESNVPFGFLTFSNPSSNAHFTSKLINLINEFHYATSKNEAKRRHSYMKSFICEYTREQTWSDLSFLNIITSPTS